jgi:sugar lactone lactonase YvrE
MSDMPSQFPPKYSPLRPKFFLFPVLAIALCASGAWAAPAPAVIIDAQQTIVSGFNGPQSIAAQNNTNQNAIFVADTANNQVVAYVFGSIHPITTTPYTLTNPQAVALDAQGDLFIGDTPTVAGNTVGRVLEMTASNGNLTGAIKVVFSGAPLTNPIALAVDSTGTLFIGDYDIISDTSTVGSIFSMAPGALAPTLLPLTGTGLDPTTLVPAALLRDSSTNLYFADNGNLTGGAVYKVAATGGVAQSVPTQSFVVTQPSGLAMDGAGNLFILTLLGAGSGSGTGYNPGQQVVVVPAASPSNPYILPNTGLSTSSGMTFDSQGNLDILENPNGDIVQLDYLPGISVAPANVGQTGTPLQFNFEFNAPATLSGFRTVTQGDVSTDLTQASGGTCTTGKHDTLPGGGPTISPFYPYTCLGNYQAAPEYPGVRPSAILVRGPGGTTLASMPVYTYGFAGAEVTTPINSSITATGLQQPQSLALSGLDKKLYIADTLAATVYSTNGLGGSALTPVSTGSFTLQAPSAVALNGQGDLYIADFNLGEVIVVPTATGVAPSLVNTGGLLQHPIALAVDYLGNLYIGDAGQGGVNAGSGNPGYLVKVPVGGAAPYQINIPNGINVIFPQALATDPYSAALLIGDGGDPSGVPGSQIIEIVADGSYAGAGTVNGVTNPTGLAFDAAEDLYVLDGTANTVTVLPVPGNGYVLNFDNSSLSAASALAISPGGDSFAIANIGQGNTNELVYLNGKRSTLSFGGVPLGTQSQPQTATEYNIGNLPLTLANPFYTVNTPNAAFNLLGSSTCGNGLVLTSPGSCTMNFEFTPQSIGHATQRIMVDSNGYNSGVPILTVQGTGTSGGSVKHLK